MAADAPVVVSPEATPALAAVAFIHHAIAIYHFLVSVHRDDQVDGADLVHMAQVSSLLSKLNNIVDALENHVTLPTPGNSPLPWACRKVGQDLCLKLARLEIRYTAVDSVSRSEFREVWPVVDVEALGDRLYELVGRCPDTNISFK